MIALLLATQLSALALSSPALGAPPAPAVVPLTDRIRPSNELIRSLPARQACVNNPPGHMEVSLPATPAALYRKGDRPAKPYVRWADYPDGAVCAVGAAP